MMKLFHEKPCAALIFILNEGLVNITQIQKQIDSTYMWAFVMINQFEKEQLVYTAKEGRERGVVLTEKGKELAGCLKQACEIVGRA